MVRAASVTTSGTSQTSSSELTLQFGARGEIAYGAITRIRCLLVSGSGATIDPIMGYATDPGSAGKSYRIFENGTAAADIDVVPVTPIPFRTDSDGKCYLRPICNAGSDNVVYVEIHYEPRNR